MRTIREIHEEAMDSHTGDLSRDISELGLARVEVEAQLDFLTARAESMNMGEVVASRMNWLEGFLTGIAYQKERGKK